MAFPVQFYLLVGFGIHEYVIIAVRIKVLVAAFLETHVLDLFTGPEGVLHHLAVLDVLEFGAHEGRPLAGFYVLEFNNGPYAILVAHGVAGPEVACISQVDVTSRQLS